MKQPPETDPKRNTQTRSSSLAIGAATMFTSGVFRQLLGFLTLAVTARLLTPVDFGVIAYFFIAVMLLDMLLRQIAMVLIRIDNVTPEHLNTVFTLQIIFGLFAACFFWTIKPLVEWFGIIALVEILPALSALSILSSLRNPKFLLYERSLRFTRAAADEFINHFTYAITAMYLAWLWQDFWAVIVAVFVGLTARHIFAFSCAPMMPKLTLSRWKESVAFSSWAIGSQLAQFFANNMPLLTIGATLGLADAGLFRVGNRITDVVTTQFFAPLLRVIYPGLAEISRSTDRKKEAFIRINTIMFAIILPISIGTALVSQDVILFGLGFKWIAAAQVIWLLAPLRAMTVLQATVRAASYVDGSTRFLFMRNSLLLVLVCLYMWIGVQFEFHGALVAAGFSNFTALIITLTIAKRFGNGGFFEPLTVAWRSFAACAVMVIAVIGTDFMLRSGLHPPRLLVIVLTKVGVGATIYTTTHIALWILSGRPEGFESFVFSMLSRLQNRIRRPQQ